MSELDFDELDKAVKQLMGGAVKVATDDVPKQKTLTLKDTLKPGETPAYDRLGKVAEGIGSETLLANQENESVAALDSKLTDNGRPPTFPSVQAPALEREEPRRTTPSRPAERDVAAARPATRGRFMDVMHQSSDMTTANTTQSPAVSLPSTEPQEVEAPSVAEHEAPQLTTTPAETPVAAVRRESAPIEPIETLKTPFLPDAKVEKRPLGAVDQQSPAEDSISDAFASGTTKQFEDIPSEPLSSVGVENASQTSPESIDMQVPLDPVESAAESAEALQLQKIEAAEIETSSTHEEKPTEGGIYDVNSYHQPINHPSKQKSSWLVVIIILVIIVLAAALGAGAYFMLGLGS